MSIFSVNNLQSIRRDNVLFEDVSFQLNKGGLLQIDGVNGSGKSTFLRICAGLTFPNEGQVFWDKKEIHQNRDSYIKNMTYIGHTNGVKELLTAEENMKVMHSLSGRNEELDCNHILEQLGMNDMDEVLLTKMSAGQKRRIALTRLLIEESNLWILDEPFTSLDVNGKKIVDGLISDHCEQGGMVIFATHQAIEIEGHEVKHIHLGTSN